MATTEQNIEQLNEEGLNLEQEEQIPESKVINMRVVDPELELDDPEEVFSKISKIRPN